VASKTKPAEIGIPLAVKNFDFAIFPESQNVAQSVGLIRGKFRDTVADLFGGNEESPSAHGTASKRTTSIILNETV
jgi:hypothetical protein